VDTTESEEASRRRDEVLERHVPHAPLHLEARIRAVQGRDCPRDYTVSDPLLANMTEACRLLEAAGMGAPGKPNCLVDMVRELIERAEAAKLDASAARATNAHACRIRDEAIARAEAAEEVGLRVHVRGADNDARRKAEERCDCALAALRPLADAVRNVTITARRGGTGGVTIVEPAITQLERLVRDANAVLGGH
jgi:hypothetical protein